MSINEKMTAIADAIRDKTGGTDILTLDDMATEIPNVYGKGKQDATCAFWNAFTANGTRNDYNKGFYYWDCEYIRPNRKIVPKGSQTTTNLFAYNQSLKKVESEYFDFSQVGEGDSTSDAYYYMFTQCSNLEEIEDVNFIAPFGWAYTFRYCSSLKKIARLPCKESTQFTNTTFGGCSSLEYIRIDGVIGQNNFNMADCKKLDKDSLTSIITHLSLTATGKSITVSNNAVVNAFTESEWEELIADYSNWKISRM